MSILPVRFDALLRGAPGRPLQPRSRCRVCGEPGMIKHREEGYCRACSVSIERIRRMTEEERLAYRDRMDAAEARWIVAVTIPHGEYT